MSNTKHDMVIQFYYTVPCREKALSLYFSLLRKFKEHKTKIYNI
jgi:hypothetical protein